MYEKIYPYGNITKLQMVNNRLPCCVFSNIMKEFDVFGEQKEKSFTDSEYASGVLMMHLLETQQKIQENPEILQESFKQFFKVCIFGKETLM